MHKQGLRAVIDIMDAEVPEVEPHPLPAPVRQTGCKTVENEIWGADILAWVISTNYAQFVFTTHQSAFHPLASGIGGENLQEA